MRVNQNYIKIVLLLLLLVSLYSFTNHRSKTKKIESVSIKFLGDNNLYLTKDAVNKLLIQNYDSVKNGRKEKVVLNTIENLIKSNPMVKNAQVYLTVKGELISQVVQRKPIARVEGASRFYLDDLGNQMPFSKNYSARVPLVTGKINDETLRGVHTIMKEVMNDDFLHKNVIGVHIGNDQKYQLKLRTEDFDLFFGRADNCKRKFANFKAFYLKSMKDSTLDAYAVVNLEFKNQVICTKK